MWLGVGGSFLLPLRSKTGHRRCVATVEKELKTLAHCKVQFEVVVPGSTFYLCAMKVTLL